jgi:hypothetical protein
VKKKMKSNIDVDERDKLKAYIDELLKDPVRMAELNKHMEDMVEREREREFEYQLQQREAWDKHKHDTYY